MNKKIRLGVNIDHVATLRNARGHDYPDLIRAADLVVKGGADSLTIHLREDRRHIRDDDVFALKKANLAPLNLEIAMTDEMLSIARKAKPNYVCIVPEKREEITTESGLDVIKFQSHLTQFIQDLKQNSIFVSLFVDPNLEQIKASHEVGADAIEIHTGKFANPQFIKTELDNIRQAAKLGSDLGLSVHAGHGLTYDNILPLLEIKEIVEYNIGHFLVAESLFLGLKESVKIMRQTIDK